MSFEGGADDEEELAVRGAGDAAADAMSAETTPQDGVTVVRLVPLRRAAPGTDQAAIVASVGTVCLHAEGGAFFTEPFAVVWRAKYPADAMVQGATTR